MGITISIFKINCVKEKYQKLQQLSNNYVRRIINIVKYPNKKTVTIQTVFLFLQIHLH